MEGKIEGIEGRFGELEGQGLLVDNGYEIIAALPERRMLYWVTSAGERKLVPVGFVPRRLEYAEPGEAVLVLGGEGEVASYRI